MHHLTQQHCWQIRLPKNLAPEPPKFHFGDWVPLGSCLQKTDCVIWFGQIRSIIFDGSEFYYSVTVPNHHPNIWFSAEETYSEEEILDAMQRLGV